MADFPVIASNTAPQVDQFLAQSGTTVTLTTNVGTILGVWVNGVAQRKTTDWSLAGQVVTFVSTLVSDDVIVAYTTSQATLNGNISIVHQEFASASGTTVTLNQTNIGGVAVVARNGVVQRETTDYTVNYTTGVITFTTTLVSEQITVAYISGGGGVGNATTLNGFTTATSASSATIPVLNANGVLPVPNAVALATTTPLSWDLTTGDVFSLTPTQAMTLNAASVANGRKWLVVTTSGTSSFVLTFGTSFKTTGTLTTGAVTAKVFVMQFVSDGVNWNEVSRTAAM